MGGKEKSSSLGRALVRQHNQMVQQSKDKGAVLRKQNKKVLMSYTETTDIEAVIEQAEEAARVHSLSNPTPILRIDTSDEGSAAERRARQSQEEALYAASLRVPRRPRWTSRMTVEELDANEKQAFLEWRRSLARIEENEKLVLTPFEKNLDIWRQLWRVLERSDLLVMVVDSRNPLFYRCPDLEAYAKEIDEHKKTLLLVNKADLLSSSVRKKWAKYFQLNGILFVFWSAKAASASLDGKRLSSPWKEQLSSEESALLDKDVKIYSRDELLARLQAEAEAIVDRREANKNDKEECSNVSHGYEEGLKKPVVVGFVGYPNVGKSSTINALVGEKRTGVTSTPGKTKHFQTLVISDKLILCDCPGLVFPSFSSSRYEMIASGVLPVDRMTEHREAVQVVADHVPRHVLESIYNISLPKPRPYEPQSRPPLASELLRTYCSSRGYVGSSGLPDETRAARIVLKDYIDGKLPHFKMPPGITDEVNLLDGSPNLSNLSGDQVADVEASMVDGSSSLSSLTGYQSAIKVVNITDESHNLNGDQIGSSDSDDTDDSVDKPDIHHLLNDLESFDINYGLSSTAVMKKKKSSSVAHKHHKKPQRKKDRSWRVGNDGGDGMPVARVFQKSPVPPTPTNTND